MNSLLDLSKESAKRFNLQSLHEGFTMLISEILKSSRREAMLILNGFIETGGLLAIDYGIRFIILSICNNTSIIKGKIRNYDHMLSLLSQKLHINIFLAFQNKYKVMKSSNTSPLICLYQNSTENYSILYHRAAKYLDEKPDPIHIDPTNFPFTDTTTSHQDSLDSRNPVLDLINFLATNTNSLPPLLKIQLRHKIEAASKELPEILNITSLNNLGDNYICTHNTDSVLTSCGNLHCRECIKL